MLSFMLRSSVYDLQSHWSLPHFRNVGMLKNVSLFTSETVCTCGLGIRLMLGMTS